MDREENMLLYTKGPTAAGVTAQSDPHTPSSGRPQYPLQSAIQEPQDVTEQGDLHKSKVAQTSFAFITVHPAPFHLPAPGGTSLWLFIRELVEHPEKGAQFQMLCIFPELFFQSRGLRKIQDICDLF